MAVPRSATVLTNLRCNQACRWCDRRAPVDDLAFIQRAAVEARIDAALSAGAKEIVLTGGEPTLRNDLGALIAHAARAAGQVTLETNATLVGEARAGEFARAGLRLARVNLAGGSDALDAVTQDPGGFRRTLEGIRALANAGVAIEIVATLTRSTRPLLSSLPSRLDVPVAALEIAVPVDGPDANELLAFDEAVETIAVLAEAARGRGIAVRMSRESGIPPCVFPSRSRLEHLHSFTPGTPRAPRHRQLAACTECLLAERCSGLPEAYLARRAPPPMQPIREERVRRRLSVISTVPEQIERELVTRSLGASDGVAMEEEIVRINFHCNQRCSFCFVSTHLPPADDARIERALREAGARGARIVISGGEPTLHPRLADWVRLAREVGRGPLTLQTNAIRLDEPGAARALRDAGLDAAFVSLHGATAEISDRVTEAPGTFARTVVGIDRLREAGVALVLNFVVCEINRHEPAPFLRMVAARWPGAQVNFSFVAASTDLVPRDRKLIPRYSDALPALAEAVGEAQRLGVRLCGFESMCGLPLCLVPDALSDEKLVEIPPDYDQGEFVRGPACDGCARRAVCWGLRRGYAELYGTDELRTLSSAA